LEWKALPQAASKPTIAEKIRVSALAAENRLLTLRGNAISPQSGNLSASPAKRDEARQRAAA
jgi:hypothetical protein